MSRPDSLNLHHLPVPRTIGDVDGDLLDAPEPIPTAHQPLRLVLGSDGPINLPPAPFLDDEPELESLDDTPQPDVPSAAETPMPPLKVTPSMLDRRERS